jgi:hypothetical protein
MSGLCGEDLSSLADGGTPFGEIVFIRYDDGPTSGAARCSAGTESYRFEMLASDIDGTYDRRAWDRGEEIRIFSLAVLPSTAFARFADALANSDTRQRIVEDEAYFNEVASILDAAVSPSLIIATHGISTDIIVACSVSEDEVASVQDWFSFMGFSGSA